MNNKRRALLKEYLREKYPNGCIGKKCDDCVFYVDQTTENSNISHEDILITILKGDICEAMADMGNRTVINNV